MIPIRSILALLLASLFAVPIGWCCAVIELGANDVAAAARSCCGPSCDVPSEDAPSDLPLAPPRDCCCQRSAILLDSELRIGVPLVATVAVSSVDDARVGNTLRLPHSPLSRYGPPLHVLQCVWRC